MILHVRPPERHPPTPDTRLKEPKSNATCVRDPECVDCSGFFPMVPSRKLRPGGVRPGVRARNKGGRSNEIQL
jgi:hypothetical protein